MNQANRPTIFTITAAWDAQTRVWSGYCDAVPVAAEAKTLDELLAVVNVMTADMLADNHPDVDPGTIYFQITALREMEPFSAAA